MARVPQASDIGVSSFNVGSAAQIDIGVAKEIGRAGSAIGDAVASLGGAFAEVAGKAGAAQSAQAEADYILDWNQKDFEVWGGLSKNETPDGTSWQAAAPAYTETFKSHREDPKYSSIPPQRKLVLDRQIAGSIQQRIIGEGGAARRYQSGQYNTLIQDLQTRTATTIGELGPDSPLVKDLPPTQGDSAYNRLYEERRSALHAKIDAAVGMTLSPKQAEEQKAKIDADLFATKLQWLQKNDPEAYEAALEQADKLEREEITQPEAGDATNETWRGPGSQGQKLGGLDPAEFKDYSQGRGGRPLQTVENIILHDVSGPGGGRVPKGGNIPQYHITFDKNGVYIENPLDRQAPHARAFNKNSIGIAHIGYEGDKLDPKSIENGAKAVAYVMQQTGVPAERILTHPGAGPSATKSGKDPREASWRTEVLAYIEQNKDVLLAGKMGALGSDDSKRVQAAQSGGFKAELTAYSPQRKGSKMEGGYAAARPGPDGKAEVRTLDDVLAGRSEYVTLAGNPKQYGKEYIIPSITYVDKSGNEHTLKNVRAVVHDTGSAFKKAGEDRFDVAIARDVNNKTMAANHTRWKQEGVQFVANEPNAPPVSERGLVQVAGLKGAQEEGIQVADAEGRIPQSAIQQFLGKNGAKLEEVAATEPNTPIAEIVSPEELETIRSQIPEGVDLNSVTVADAKELLAQVSPEEFTPDMGGGTGGDVVRVQEPGATPSYTQERSLGPVKPGSVFTVKSKYGNIKFRSEEWNNMKPGTIKEMQRELSAKRKSATKLNEQNAKQMMSLQERSLEETYQDSKDYNPAVLDKAFPRGTPEREEHERKIAVGRQLGKIFGNEAEMSGIELKERLELYAPTGSPKDGDALLYSDLRTKAEAKLKAIMELREKDPAAAVAKHPLVQETLSKFQNGRPQSADDRVKLARARMAAQKDIGIDPWLRSPIDDGEARAYVSDLDKIPEDRIEEGLREIMTKVKKQYGEEHSGVVLNAIVREMSRTDERRAILVQTARQMSDRDSLGLGPLVMDEANELYDMERAEADFKMYSGGSARAKSAREELFRRAYEMEQSAAQGRAPAQATRGKFYPRGAPVPGNVSRVTPSKDDLAALQNGSLSREAFAKKYGLSMQEADSALLGLVTSKAKKAQ